MKQPGTIRTRFAPSPTGHLHLGSARTALFNYLFAAHHQGQFIVRFEDTDQKRNRQSVIQKQLASLRWLGLQIAETVDSIEAPFGPYLQSERLQLYQKHCQMLLQSRQAYYCFCTTADLLEQKNQQTKSGKATFLYDRRCYYLNSYSVANHLAAKTPHCIRFLVPKSQNITFSDLTFGQMSFETTAIEDFVILKSNGYPTYNFAVVVDDYLMQITHVLRGIDHLSNTAKQLLLYQAFRWPLPAFAHFTLLQIDQKQKLSKRDFQAQHYLSHYEKIGVLPIAMRNFLVLFGWSPPNNQELLDDQQLVTVFDGTNFNRSPSIVNLSKLFWFNQKYIQKLSLTEFWQYCKPYLTVETTQTTYSIATWRKITQLFQNEITAFQEIRPLVQLFLPKQFEYSAQNRQLLQNHGILLRKLLTALQKITVWNVTNLKATGQQVQNQMNLVGKAFYHPLRIALMNQESGPPFYAILELLGRQTTCERLKFAISHA